MKDPIELKNKIIKSFYTVGLNEEQPTLYNEDDKPNLYIQNIDILIKKISINKNTYTKNQEKWLRILKDTDSWFRIQYSHDYHTPITDFKIIGCNLDEKENCLLIDKKFIDENYYPIRVTNTNNDNDSKNDVDIGILTEYIPDKSQIIDNFVKIPKEFNIKEIMKLSLKNNAAVIFVTRNFYNLPLKIIQIKYQENDKILFQRKKHKSPFVLKYNPEVLDEYPPTDFGNNNISIFCFPEGLNISEVEIEPKKFDFILTDELGKRTYYSTLIFYEKLTQKIREALTPIYKEETEKNKLKEYYIPKALCISANFPFFSSCSLFLKELYKIFTSSGTFIPLERAICGFVDSLYKQSYDKLIRFKIQNEVLDFYFIPNYGKEWDINDQYLETIFHVLSIDIISTAWQGLLLEKQLFLLCSSKETLLQVAHSFVTLLFPFKWIHTYIPILPEKLKDFSESPMPLIFGIPFPIEVKDLPNDAIIINIDKNCIERYNENTPKLTGKLKAFFEKKLNRLKEKYQIENPKDSKKWMDYLDSIDGEIPENIKRIDCGEIRDVFYEVFIQIFKNSSKYFPQKNNSEEDKIEFKKDIFLKDHGSTDDNSFLALFCDTSLFNQFINSISLIQPESSTQFFFECIKKGKEKSRVFLPNIIPKNISLAPKIKTDDIKEKIIYTKFPKLDPKYFIHFEAPIKPYKSKFIFQKDEWCYDLNKIKEKEWPKVFMYLVYEIWFNFFSTCIHFYDKNEIEPLMDYAIFLLEDLINSKKIVPTRNMFSKVFKSCGRNELSSYIRQVLFLANKVYKKSGNILFQNSYLNGLYFLTENINVYHNSFNISINNTTYNNATANKQKILENLTNIELYTFFESYIFFTKSYCPYCSKNVDKIKFISIEEFLAGLSRENDKSYSFCPNCSNIISNDIYYLNKDQKELKIQKFSLYSPSKLISQIDEIIEALGEYCFYINFNPENNKMMNLYFNLIFYFKLFDLPLFVIYIEKNKKNFEEKIITEIEESIKRKKKHNNKNNSYKKSYSPDRQTKRNLNLSNDKSYTDTERPYSILTKALNIGITEQQIWKFIYSDNKDKSILTGDKIGLVDRSILLQRIKYMKSFISNYTTYFISIYQDMLSEFLGECKSDLKILSEINEIKHSNTQHYEKKSNINFDEEKKNKNKINNKNRPQSVSKKYQSIGSENYRKDKNNLKNINIKPFDDL